MLNLRVVAWVFLVGAMVLGAGVASTQNYPSRPVRMVTSEPGGGNDFAARVIAQALTGGPLGQQVIVDNRPGIISTETVAKATPDGYTLLVTGATLWVNPLLQKMNYDAVRDFSPVTGTSTAPNILVVNPALPVKSVKELIALAKAKPGELNYASSGMGTSSHLAAELFKSMAGVNIVAVNFKGAGAAYSALIGGEVQLMFPGGSATPHINSGRLRALAVTSARPSALLPGLPTVAAAGLPGYESGVITCIFAPAKTPATIISRLNHEVVRLLNRADVKEKFFNSGVEVVGSSPEQLAATMKSDTAKWSKVIKEAGIKLE